MEVVQKEYNGPDDFPSPLIIPGSPVVQGQGLMLVIGFKEPAQETNQL